MSIPRSFSTAARAEDDPGNTDSRPPMPSHNEPPSSPNATEYGIQHLDAPPSTASSSATHNDPGFDHLPGPTSRPDFSPFPPFSFQTQHSIVLVDFRALEYVDQCNENLICPICRCPFVDPVILSECDHCFCRDCIRQTWATAPTNSYSPRSRRKDCPSCRTPATLGLRSSTNKVLTNILDDLLVRCPNNVDGCLARVKRGEIQDHITLYCGFTMVECEAKDCKLLSMRKDLLKGCLHAAVCCLACQAEMHASELEVHWHDKCPDRRINCELCSAETSCKELAQHRQHSCPGSSISCPGKTLGCVHQETRPRMAIHAKNCPLALLQPIFTTQKRRLDEQEIAQKQMSRRMKILENGFSTMRDILYPPTTTEGADLNSAADFPFHTQAGIPSDAWETQPNFSRIPGHRRSRTSGSGLGDISASLPSDMDPRTPFPFPVTNGPYTSPLHHLLSMHENLREEMSRISNALQEQEGRQSLQILNDNIRTREEMSYLGAQIAGLTRQVHWLTSTHLQRQSRSATPGAGNTGELTAAGPSVEAAVSAVNTAVRGAARIVTAGREGMGLRRGSSEEGRTKL